MPNWYRTHTVPKCGLQSIWITGAYHYRCRSVPEIFVFSIFNTIKKKTFNTQPFTEKKKITVIYIILLSVSIAKVIKTM